MGGERGGGPALPLSSNWDYPGAVAAGTLLRAEALTSRTICLAQGIYSPQHIYAGGTGLYETDTTQPSPLSQWHEIPIRGADPHRDVLQTGTINRIVVLHELNKVVLACDFGVFWATIPSPGVPYIFARLDALPGNRFSGLAEGPGNTLIAAAWGTDLNEHCGIFVGEWSSPLGTFVFHRAIIKGNDDLDVELLHMLRIDVAACATNRQVLYAVCDGGGDLTLALQGGMPQFDGFDNVEWEGDPRNKHDFIYRVLRSEDGGETWFPTGRAVAGQTRPLFPGDATDDLAGAAYSGYVGCVGVSPVDSETVAVGMGHVFVSQDGGKNWTQLASPHLHTDTHGLVFDPTDPGKLYVCCDGGLPATPDFGKTWSSAANRQLPNLEIYRCAPSPRDSGLTAASFQDNGNQYAPLYINSEPWRELDGGDGVLTMFSNNGDLVRENNETIDPTTKINWGKEARAAHWDAGDRQFHTIKMFSDPPLSNGVIPVDGTADGLAMATHGNPNGAEAVVAPGFTNGAGEQMVAVDAEGEAVFGLFAKAGGT